MALQPLPDQPIDRSETTPFLLRVFYREHSFHSPAEFATVPPTAALTRSSLDLYTWPDTTLSELTSLITTSISNKLPSPVIGTRLGYRLIFPDTRSITGPGASEEQGRWLSKPLGTVVIGEDLDIDEGTNGSSHGAPGESQRTLADARFVIGDYVSCAIVPPRSDGSVAPLPPSESSGGPSFRGSRGRGGYGTENGHGRGYGFRGRDVDRGGRAPAVPRGEWARGERLPDGPAARGGRYR